MLNVNKPCLALSFGMFSSLLSAPSLVITEPRALCRWQHLVYALKVSKRRRSIGFQVGSTGVVVTVPYGLSQGQLEEAIAAKYQWLLDKLEQVRQQCAQRPTLPARLMDGDLWPVWGKWLPVHISQGKSHGVHIHKDHIELLFTPRQKTQPCRWRLWQHWYRQQAQAFAAERVDHWCGVMAPQLPQLPARVTVRQYRGRWGSCSSRGEIKFNYVLAMVPEAVFDYVVVHEVCHLRYMHHGPEFWALVEKHCPLWRQHRHWLKDNGVGLFMELST